MNDIEKLTQMIVSSSSGCTENDAERIAAHLLANRVLVPSFALGDSVFVIGGSSGEIAELFISHIDAETLGYRYEAICKSRFCCHNDPCMAEEEICKIVFREYEIGRTLFQTKEEALTQQVERAN